LIEISSPLLWLALDTQPDNTVSIMHLFYPHHVNNPGVCNNTFIDFGGNGDTKTYKDKNLQRF